MAFEIIDGRDIAPGKQYVEAACLSADTKPTDVNFVSGSIAVEVDTGTVYFFDAASGQWVEQFSFQG